MSDLPTGTSGERPRVALFQAFWRLHSSTVYSAQVLADSGYRVEVFLFTVDDSIPMSALNDAEGIFVHRIEAGKNFPRSAGGSSLPVPQLRRIFSALRRRAMMPLWSYVLLLLKSDKGLIPKDVLDQTIRAMDGQRYRAYIGIEKGGLIWAGAIARRRPTALIYSNLELYKRNHPFFVSSMWARRIKAAEEMNHARCWATIVQDPIRGNVLLDDNRITRSTRMLYVPTSRMGRPVSWKSRCWRRQLGIEEEKIVIVSHGMIAEGRFCIELAELAQAFPDNWLLVFHGFGERSIIHRISNIDTKQHVRLSLDLVDLAKEPEVMRSADISLVLYQNETQNDCLTGFSSEKLALSLQCGVPIIAFNYPSYEHIRDEGCGILVDDLSEIPRAASKILADYANYSSRAYRAFEKYYRFEANFQKVLAALNELN